MRFSCLHFVLLATPLLLAGCGDGWEAQRTTEILPYGNQRTAGSGVVYVRAKMMPEREIVVEQKASQPQGYEEIKSGEEVFARAQTKGVEPQPAAKIEKKKKDIEEKKKDVEKESKETKKKEIKDAEEKSAVVPAAGEISPYTSTNEETKKTLEKKEAPKKTYEQMLDEQSGGSPAVSPEKVEPHAGNAEPEKQSSLISAPGSASIDIIQVPEEVKFGSKSSNKAIMPVKEIRSPMMDVYNRSFEAEKSLEEIYSNPF